MSPAPSDRLRFLPPRFGANPKRARGDARAGRLGLATVLIGIALLALPHLAAAQVARSDFAVTNGQVNAVEVTGGTLYVGGSFTRVGPPTGSGVPVNAVSGAQAAVFPLVVGQVSAIAEDGSGGWYIGGTFSTVGGLPRANLAHVLADGSVSSWDPGANGLVRALVVGGGTVYAAGDFTGAGGQSRAYVAALDTATGAARAWNPGANGSVRALAMNGGTLLAGGTFTTIGGAARDRLAALDTLTGQAGAWNPGCNGPVRAIAAAGGTVYVGGQFASAGGQPRFNLAALNAVTGEATGWNPSANAQVAALQFSDGVVYAGGDFTFVGGQARSRIAAIDFAAGLATAWNPGANASVLALRVAGDVLYAGGDFTTIGGQTRGRVAALDLAGGAPTAWDPEAYGTVAAIAAQGSTVYLGGSLGGVGGLARKNLAAIDLATGQATAWAPEPDGQVLALAAGDGVLYVGGSFTAIGGRTRRGLAAIERAGGTATTWAPGVDGSVAALVSDGARVYVGGNFTTAGGAARDNLAALDAASGIALPWAPQADGPIFALALANGLVHVGGTFLSCGGLDRGNLAAVDTVTGSATAWNPQPNGTVRGIAPACGTIYVGGFFSTIGGQARSRIAALDATTGLARAWNPNASGPVYSVVLADGAVYVGGIISTIGGQARNRLASIDPGTGLATAWNPDCGGTVRTIVVADGAVYAGGSFATMGAQPLPNVAAVATDGSLSCPVIALASGPPPGAVVGTPWSWSLAASGGTAPYCHALVTGRLPDGIALDAATGTIAGTPAAAGVFAFAVQATDAHGCTARATYTLEVTPAGAVATIAADVTGLGITLAHPCVSVPFVLARSDTAAARAAMVRFHVDPARLALCTPATPGTSVHPGPWLAAFPNVALQVQDLGDGSYEVDLSILGPACGATGGGAMFTVDLAAAGADGHGAIAVTSTALRDCANLPLRVQPGPDTSLAIENEPLVVVPAALPGATQGVAYRETLATTAGTAPFAFALAAGALPPGLTLSPAGVLAGTPAAPGSFAFTVGVADAYGCPGARDYAIDVACPAVAVRPAVLPGGVVGTPCVQVLAAADGTPPYAFELSGGALPEGLALAPSGALTGTPTAAGSSQFAVTATDSFGCTGTRSYVVATFATAPRAEVAASTDGLCITPNRPWVSVPFVLTRADTAPARAASVTLQIDVTRLALHTPSSPAASVHPGSWLAAFPGTGLQVLDNGGGSYTVDETILGPDCGASGGGALFSVDLESVGGDGGGTIAVTAVSLRDCANLAVPVAPGAATAITIEDDVPAAIADLAAARVVAAEDTASTCGIRLTWTASAADTVTLYRAPFGSYPEYGDDTPVEPPDPAAAPGAPWVLAATGAASGVVDHPPMRGFWYYVARVTDACGSVSQVSNRTAGTLDYVLGDVSDGRAAGAGNGAVGTEDVSLLGAHYGIDDAAITARHVEYLDVGPTLDGSPASRPTPDDRIDLEDLMILALGFHSVPAPAPARAMPAGADSAPAEEFRLDAPALVEAGQSVTARLWLRGAGRIQGFSARLAWDPSVVRPVDAAGAGFVESQGGVVLSPAPGVVDAALLGPRAGGLAGEGAVAEVRFVALRDGDAGLGLAAVTVRDARNRPLDDAVVRRGAGLAPPARATLLAPAPNPFAGATGLTFGVPRPGPVELVVFGVDGRRVRTLVRGALDAGVHHATWSGDDDERRPVAAGVYYVRLSTASGRVTQRLVHLR